jgi:hypothetical protein
MGIKREIIKIRLCKIISFKYTLPDVNLRLNSLIHDTINKKSKKKLNEINKRNVIP